ncbi:protein pex20 [Aspergillus stella-maris]|uniref:protein pex20 n=1 Tax=Aspergillus stella-maris TaxID=1810926 RepID=UPI003CCE3C2D
MSDALCGPSNALQNLQKHTSVDRTLQQDRLISRQSPSQGFRSQNPNEGILDPEFAAFESNNGLGAPLPEAQHGHHFMPPAPQMPMSHPAEAPNWASDFQNLHISGPSQPIHHKPTHTAAPLAASQQGWHAEFMGQQQHTPAPQQNQPFAQRFQPSFTSTYVMNSSPMQAYSPAQETTASKSATTEAFDESAFEAAFEQARADMESQFEAQVETNASDSSTKNQAEEAPIQPEAQETIRIGSDTIPQANKEDLQTAANDADELARTAGQLLHSVSHETNQKFKESNFLALMRRIRDREVQVEGDEFRETAQSLHPGGPYYPEGQRQKEAEAKDSWRPIGQGDYVHVPTNETNIESGHLASHTTISADPSASSTESTGNSGSADYDSLYASWNHGDRWA